MGMNDDLKVNFDKIGKACKQVGEEWENLLKDDRPFDAIKKIAKDIADRQDREVALEFTKCICELLKKNGVAPKIETLEERSLNDYAPNYHFSTLITGLDFTEHDKKFKDEINQLKYELSKKADFETYGLVKLPFDALETANMLINATYKRENCMNGKVYDKDIYSIDDLEQIAEHLLVYCKHNREDEE